MADDKIADITISFFISFAKIPSVSVFLFCKLGLKCFIFPVNKISIASNNVVFPYPFCPSKITILLFIKSNFKGLLSVIYFINISFIISTFFFCFRIPSIFCPTILSKSFITAFGNIGLKNGTLLNNRVKNCTSFDSSSINCTASNTISSICLSLVFNDSHHFIKHSCSFSV